MDLEQLFSKITMSDEEENDGSFELSGDCKRFDTIENVLEHQLQNRTSLKTDLESIELKIKNTVEEIQKTEKQGENMRKKLSGEKEELQRFREICTTIENAHLTLQNSEKLIKTNLHDLEAKLQRTFEDTNNTKVELDEIVKKYTAVYEQRINKENLDSQNKILNETKNDLFKAETEYKKALQIASENKSTEEQLEDYKKYVIEIAQVYVDLMKNKNTGSEVIVANQFSTRNCEMITEVNEFRLRADSNATNPESLTQGTELARELNDMQLSLQSNAADTQPLTQGTQLARELNDLQLTVTGTQSLIQEMNESEINSDGTAIKIVENVQVPAEQFFNFSSTTENQQNRNFNLNQCFDVNRSTDRSSNQEESNFLFNFNQCFDASKDKPTSNVRFNLNPCLDDNATIQAKLTSNQEESNFRFNF